MSDSVNCRVWLESSAGSALIVVSGSPKELYIRVKASDSWKFDGQGEVGFVVFPSVEQAMKMQHVIDTLQSALDMMKRSLAEGEVAL